MIFLSLKLVLKSSTKGKKMKAEKERIEEAALERQRSGERGKRRRCT